MKILVLGTDTKSFLTVVRSLGRAGHEVHVAWYEDGSAALSSRYIRAKHALAPFREGDAHWVVELQTLLAENQIDLVLPCSDSVIFPLQAVQDTLRTNAKIYLLPKEIYEVANSKIRMHQIASELGIPVSAGATITSKEDAHQALGDLSSPWVFRPEFSYARARIPATNSVQKAFARDEALQLVPEFLGHGRFQIQQNFVGVGTGVDVLANRGEVLLEFQHVRVHEPLHGGGSSYRKGIPPHPGMLDAAKKLMARLRYTGVAMVEFKWDQATDEWIFIELNARFWGSLPLAVASGCDFPLALFELLMFDKRPSRNRIRSDLYARTLRDIDWLISNISADKNDRVLCALPGKVVLKEVLNILRGKERWDSLAWDDPAPFRRELVETVSSKAGAIVRRIVCSKKYLVATRPWRRARLERKLQTAKNIGFVCYGNICRSPFAEVYARSQASGVNFFSAGFHRSELRSPPDSAIAAAELLEVDLSRHRSRLLSAEAAQTADILFVFDRSNLRQMHFSFATAMTKTFLLSDLSITRSIDIEDPWGHDIPFFSETYRAIQFFIDEMSHDK